MIFLILFGSQTAVCWAKLETQNCCQIANQVMKYLITRARHEHKVGISVKLARNGFG